MRWRGWIGAGCAALFLGGCANEREARGVVVDARTNQPIAGAYVHVAEEGRRTDEDGKYEMDEIDARAGALVPIYVLAPGYEPIREIRTFDVGADGEAGISFTMRPEEPRREPRGVTDSEPLTPRTQVRQPGAAWSWHPPQDDQGEVPPDEQPRGVKSKAED